MYTYNLPTGFTPDGHILTVTIRDPRSITGTTKIQAPDPLPKGAEITKVTLEKEGESVVLADLWPS
jgi:hypothetical protein